VSADDLVELKPTIKEEMPDWLEALGRYHNPMIAEPLRALRNGASRS
jgi:hypothetical protein